MRFVDTNVLLYAISGGPEEAPKRRIARAVLEDSDLVVSVQVLQELYAQATRPTRPEAMRHDEAVRFIVTLLHFPVQPITLDVFQRALEYRERFRLSYWDSAILAAAKVSGCDTVLTEDLNSGQDYDGLRTANPFAHLTKGD